MAESDYRELENRLKNWGLSDNNISAAIIIGSRARNQPPDAYSDLDLILYTHKPLDLVTNPDWLSRFTEPWITRLDFTAMGDPEWILICEQGLKVDLVIQKTSPAHTLDKMLAKSPYLGVLSRGYRILLDKTGSKEYFDGGEPQPLNPPDIATFNDIYDQTLISVYRTAKFARRKDLWRAQKELTVVRQCLLQFFQWHTIRPSTSQVDTWYDGRLIDIWADPRIVTTLPELFPAYEAKAILHSLANILAILEYVSQDIAQSLEYLSPTYGQNKLMAWLQRFIKGD